MWMCKNKSDSRNETWCLYSEGKQHRRCRSLSVLPLSHPFAHRLSRSLTHRAALGNVINALTDTEKRHVPYRDSKLTRLLQVHMHSFAHMLSSLALALLHALVSARMCARTVM